MAREVKDVEVVLEALQCTNAEGDSGTNIEVFGQLEARGVFIDANGEPRAGARKVMWQQDDGINLAPRTELRVNSVAAFPVFKGDFLWIGGRIVEEDDFDDDLLGDGFRKLRYPEIKNGIVNVGFNKDEQEVIARYNINVKDIRIDPNA
ncbi:hypothetical protein O7635_30965 [Asanoa sp. WMMD1127]|uniref:hypothetical protein n=1 Tax=Asanoa sp. WMMD1127 TaxID=3016107 RepID=UPI0024163BFD|nr:hypothetical protein [Asanoa sp. WMMD1127]MDG4826293.1 hypothetical protein [Asanoa sp. WMMD1127]